MTEIMTRVATAADAAFVAQMMEQLTGRVTAAAEQTAQIEAILAGGDRYRLLVAERGGRPAGVAFAQIGLNLCCSLSPYMEVVALTVDQAARRGGVGTALMRALEEWAAAQGCRYITLSSQHHRTGAHRFYEALGYDHDDAFQKISGPPITV